MRHGSPKHQKSHDNGQTSSKRMGRLHGIPTIEQGSHSTEGTPAKEAAPSPTKTSRIPDPLPLGTAPNTDEADEDIETRLAYESLVKHRKQRRRKKIITVCVIVGILAVAGIAWAVVNSSQGSAGNEEIGTPTTTVVRQDFEESVTASGAVKPISSVAVTPEVEGIIDTVSVAEGDAVSAGQQLFTIRNDALDKAIRDADISLRGAKNDAGTAWDNYQTALKAYKNGTFADDEGEGGQTGVEKANQAKAAMNEAYIAYESADLARETAQSAYDEAVANGQKRTVVAPIAGSVVSMSAVAGASTSASQNGSLMQIADLSQMSVTVQVNELDISKIAVEQTATVTFSALPGVSLDATVTHIASVATGDSSDYSGYGVVTYAVDLVIPEPDSQLKPGMTASVSIKMQSIPDALCVPSSALVASDDGTYYLDVVTNEETGEIEEREVTVVAQNSTTAVVEGDIQEGDVVQMLGWASGSSDDNDTGTVSSSSSASAETAA